MSEEVEAGSGRTVKPNADAIKQLRTARGWTIADAAKAVGCSERTFSNLEKGKRVYAATLRDVAKAFGVEYRSLLSSPVPPARSFSEGPTIKVQITIDISRDQMDEAEELLAWVANFKSRVNAKYDLEVTDMSDGSTKITVEMAEEDYLRLQDAWVRGDLHGLGITDLARMIGQTSARFRRVQKLKEWLNEIVGLAMNSAAEPVLRKEESAASDEQLLRTEEALGEAIKHICDQPILLKEDMTANVRLYLHARTNSFVMRFREDPPQSVRRDLDAGGYKPTDRLTWAKTCPPILPNDDAIGGLVHTTGGHVGFEGQLFDQICRSLKGVDDDEMQTPHASDSASKRADE